MNWLPPTVSNRAGPVNSRAPSPRWLGGNGGECRYRPGRIDLARINCTLVHSPNPGGVQSQCRPDLSGISNRRFHWISFLDGELRDVQPRKIMIRRSVQRLSEKIMLKKKWRGPAESNRYLCAG